jgi:hypothetical protein
MTMTMLNPVSPRREGEIDAAPRLRSLDGTLLEHLRTRRPIWVDMARLPITDRHEDMQVLVVVGPGIQAQFLPSYGATRAITERVAAAR